MTPILEGGMGRQVKFGVRIHQHGYTFEDLKRVSSTLAEYIGAAVGPLSPRTLGQLHAPGELLDVSQAAKK